MPLPSLRRRAAMLLVGLVAFAQFAIVGGALGSTGSCEHEWNVIESSVAGSGDVVVLPADGYSGGERTHIGCVEGDADLDLSLSLVRGQPGEDGTVVATADDGGAEERLSTYQTAGDFYWTVTSVDGAGAFTFGYSFGVPPTTTDWCAEYQHHESAVLEAPGDRVELPADGYATNAVLLHEGCLEGPGGSDYDLHFARIEADGSRTVLESGSPAVYPNGHVGDDSSERLARSVAAGRYVWIVENVEGTGTFSFGYGTREPQPPDGCDLEDVVTGRLDGPGDTAVVAVVPTSVEAGTPVTGCLRSAEGTDVDLALQRYDAGRGRFVDVEVSERFETSAYVEHEAAGGRYRWVVRAVAGVGEFRFGHTAVPGTVFTSTPPRQTTEGDWVSFGVKSTEGDNHFYCRLDGEPRYSCGSPMLETDLPVGKHRFEVSAIDPAFNVDPTPVVWTWEVVEAPPEPQQAAPLGSELFTDVPYGHTFDREIGLLRQADVTRGCGPDTFCPSGTVTRGQMAAFLVRALGLAAGTARFDDTRGHVFEADIAALADAGVTRGCGGGDFCPDDPVTRGQMAAFLVRALGLPAGTARFDDTRGHVFEADIAALADAGVTRGCGGGDFCPDDPVSRGQMAAFLERADLLR